MIPKRFYKKLKPRSPKLKTRQSTQLYHRNIFQPLTIQHIHLITVSHLYCEHHLEKDSFAKMDADPTYYSDEMISESSYCTDDFIDELSVTSQVTLNSVTTTTTLGSNHAVEDVQDLRRSPRKVSQIPRRLDWVVDREPQDNEVGDDPTPQTPIHKNGTAQSNAFHQSSSLSRLPCQNRERVIQTPNADMLQREHPVSFDASTPRVKNYVSPME